MTPVRRLVGTARDWRADILDARLNIRTRTRPGTTPPASRFGDAVAFAHLDYGLIRALLRAVPMSREDVFMDVGCGKGRELCLLARRPLKKCIGIEIDRDLARIAAANARSLRGRRCPIEIVTGDAVDADYSEATVIWFCHPFGERTMRHVAGRIRASLVAAPRRVRIIHFRAADDPQPDFHTLFAPEEIRDISAWFNSGVGTLLALRPPTHRLATAPPARAAASGN
jgi:predicted RNA methylase